MPGATTSASEVTNISKHGLWLFTADGEHRTNPLTRERASRKPGERLEAQLR